MNEKQYINKSVVRKIECYEFARDIISGKATMSEYVKKFGSLHMNEIFIDMLRIHDTEYNRIIDECVRHLEIEKRWWAISRIKKDLQRCKNQTGNAELTEEEREQFAVEADALVEYWFKLSDEAKEFRKHKYKPYITMEDE